MTADPPFAPDPGAGPNRALLVAAARRLGPLLGEFVFVGGHVAELLVTDPGATRVRPTDDVDVIVAVTTRSAYERLTARLRARGFRHDTAPLAPLCRFRAAADAGAELVLDVMPLDPEVLGFSNPWYAYALESAIEVRIAPDVVIRAANAPAFVATKFAAYAHRGADDPLTSADLEDIITVVAGRPSLLEEVRRSPTAVREWIARATRALLADPRALDVLEGSLPDARYDRTLVPRMEARLAILASLTD